MLVDMKGSIVVGLLFYIVVGMLSFIKRRKVQKPFVWTNELVKLLFCIYIIMVISVTLLPLVIGGGFAGNSPYQSLNYVPLVSIISEIGQIGTAYGGDTLFMIQLIARNVGGNILMLMPMGFLAPILWRRFRRPRNILILGLLVSLTIECLQLIELISGVGMGRAVDIDDVICNGLGTFLGYLIYRLFLVLWKNIQMA